MAGKITHIIDKTAAVEEMIQTSAAVCLCGMPGVGKKTLVRLLREKHPEVHSIICSLEDLTPVPPNERQGKSSPLVETADRSFPTICPRLMSSSFKTERSERSRQRNCFRLLTMCLAKRKQQTRLSNRFLRLTLYGLPLIKEENFAF